MRFALLLIATVALVPLGACSRASSGRDVRITNTPQSPEVIARLEEARRENPGSGAAARALGISYYKAGRFQEARETLEAARRLDPNDGTAALYLGLTYESLDDIAGAREAYKRYIENGKTKSVRQQLEARVAYLNRRELELAAKRSIANEAELASQPGSPTTIAVLPLTFTGTDSSLAPLERGIAELIVTDLGRLPALTVVERDRLQALVDEIKRTQGEQFDSTSQLRTGRLVRAGRIIQGSINQTGDQEIQLNAAVVDVPTSQILRTARASDQLENLFDMEKRLIFDIVEGLGLVITARERGLLEQRPTRSLAAFLAYSRGLQEEDRGNLDRANEFFQQAVRIDPGFQGASQSSQRTQAAVSGSQVSSASVESNLQGTSEGAVVAAAEQGTVVSNVQAPSTSGTLSTTTNSLNPSPSSSATTSGVTNSGQTQTTTTTGPVSTSAGSSTGTGTTPPPTTTNTQGTATGNTNPTRQQTGTITIIIRPPTE
jgi:tetratricopeptide (TPR) repeat protein